MGGENKNYAPAAVLIICLLLLFSSSIPESTSDPDEALPLTVKTLDGKTLPNAVVKIYNYTAGLVVTVTTDSGGKALLPKDKIDEAKPYKLVVEYPRGFQVHRNDSFVYGQLGKSEVRVNVLSEWTLIVSDKSGRDMLRNVDVQITHEKNDTIAYKLKTDENGKVKFYYVPLGESRSAYYLVNISYAGRMFESWYECSEDGRNINVKLDLYRVVVKLSDVLNRPVEGLLAEVRGGLEEEPISSSASNSTGYSVLKLVPNGEYYLTVKLGEYTVYESREKEVEVHNKDEELSITAQVVKLNITVYDYDGEGIISNLNTEIIGEVRDPQNNRLVSRASTLNGELRFNYVPLRRFKLTVAIAGIVVYSQDYEVSLQNAQGSIKARFYDTRLVIDGKSLVNPSVVNRLNGILKKESLEIPLNFQGGYASLQNIPAYSGYLIKLYYKDVEVLERNIDVTKDEEEISIEVRGVNLTITTLNIYNEPIPAEVKIYLEDNVEYFAFKTDDSGSAEAGELLPITYKLKAYSMNVECFEATVQPRTSTSYTLILNVKNVYVKLYDKDMESTIPEALIELYAGKSKTSSMTNSSGIAFFKNIPSTKYFYRVFMHGFKVGEGETEVSLDRDFIELIAPGILDLRLSIVDGDKQPVDGGQVVITVGDGDVVVDVDRSGQARVVNLPNTTLYISGLYYKGVKVKTEPNEITLVRDEMMVPLTANIYTLQASIKLKNGELMRFGEVNLYINGEKTSEIDISENNPLTERLPGGELRIDVVFKDVKVATKAFTLDSSKELTITAEVYRFTGTVYSTLGERLKGLKIRVEGGRGPVEELETDENGVIDTYLPIGVYRIKIGYSGSEYGSLIEVKDTTRMSFMLPIEVLNPLFIMLLPLVNFASISAYFIKNLKKERARQKKEKKERSVRKVLRI